jgi:hypothetical protein
VQRKTVNSLLDEAAQWRRVAESISNGNARLVGNSSWGLTYSAGLCDLLRIDKPWGTTAMRARLNTHMSMFRRSGGGLWLDTPGRRQVRVLACLFMALEAESEAEEMMLKEQLQQLDPAIDPDSEAKQEREEIAEIEREEV